MVYTHAIVSERARAALRIGLSIIAAAAIALTLHRWLGQSPQPLHFSLPGRWLPETLRKPIELQRPSYLWGLVVLPWFALMATVSLADLPWYQRSLGVVVRSVLFGLFLIALSRPVTQTHSQKVCTVFLLDVSQSVPDETIAGYGQLLESALRARGDNLLRVVVFAKRPTTLELPSRLSDGQHIGSINPVALSPRVGGRDATDLASALSFAYGQFPAGYLRRVVVLSDGVQTDGDVLSEASRAARFGVRISVIPSRAPAPAEVAIRGLHVPDRITVDQPFDVRATVFSSRAGRARFTLRQGESLNGLDGQRVVELHPGEQELRFRSVVRVPGDVTYALSVDPLEGDRFSENNRYVTTATVPGRPTVLYIEGDATRGQWFRGALSAGGFEVEQRSGREFPQSVRELERFDFVVLSDVAADQVSAGAQESLGRYIRELGGGFMMAGGARGYGLGGWQGTTVERLLPVRMESERRRDQPSLALVLVIDRSGSMQGQPLLLAQSAALATARALGPDDLIEVIAFDTQPDRVVRMQSARNRVRIENELRRLRPGGGTAIFPAVDAANQDLALTRASTRHVIVLTDGQGQPDEPPRLRVLVEAMAADGITVSTVGFGTQVDRELLESLARRGRGRSYVTADAHSLPQIFLRETSMVARSAAVESPVVPRVVTSAGFLRELQGGAVPYLYGYVSTRAKGPPAQVMLESDTGEPLLSRWRVGLGWSLAWTSDLKNRWAVEWIRWPRWQAFWTQLVREHMRQRRREELGLHGQMIAGRLHVAVDAITDDDRFRNGLDSELTIRGPAPSNDVQRVPLRQVAPGRYEATTVIDRYGAFTLRAVHKLDGRIVSESVGRFDNPYPREYAVLAPDLALLHALAGSTNGTIDPSLREVFAPGRDRVERAAPVQRYALFAALAVLLLDLALRRIRFG